jgi:hypothetical protein
MQQPRGSAAHFFLFGLGSCLFEGEIRSFAELINSADFFVDAARLSRPRPVRRARRGHVLYARTLQYLGIGMQSSSSSNHLHLHSHSTRRRLHYLPYLTLRYSPLPRVR